MSTVVFWFFAEKRVSEDSRRFTLLPWNLHLLLGTKTNPSWPKARNPYHRATPNTRVKKLNLPFSSPIEMSKKQREFLFALIIWENVRVKGKIALFWLNSQLIETHEVQETVYFSALSEFYKSQFLIGWCCVLEIKEMAQWLGNHFTLKAQRFTEVRLILCTLNLLSFKELQV